MTDNISSKLLQKHNFLAIYSRHTLHLLVSYKLIVVFLFLFTYACSNGNDGGDPNDSTDQTGVLIDSVVSGLSYQTQSYSGKTNEFGQFKYNSGEQITFQLGDINIGTAEAAPVMSPVNFSVQSNSTLDNITTNLSVFLQTIDDNNSLSDGIQITKAMEELSFGVTLDFTLEPLVFQTDSNVLAVFQRLIDQTSYGNRPIVDLYSAQDHLIANLIEQSSVNINWHSHFGLFEGKEHIYSIETIEGQQLTDYRRATKKLTLSDNSIVFAVEEIIDSAVFSVELYDLDPTNGIVVRGAIFNGVENIFSSPIVFITNKVITDIEYRQPGSDFIHVISIEDVTVPYGTFSNSVKLTTLDETRYMERWLVPEVGIVKTVSKSPIDGTYWGTTELLNIQNITQ